MKCVLYFFYQIFISQFIMQANKQVIGQLILQKNLNTVAQQHGSANDESLGAGLLHIDQWRTGIGSGNPEKAIIVVMFDFVVIKLLF